MSDLDAAIMQRDFALALLQPGETPPPGPNRWDEPRFRSRFAVHRNNVVSSLVAALASRFPVTERIVGTAFFAAMARAFINRHPPRSPVLFTYGDDLADFIAEFEPAASVAYLSDIARLEAARGGAYHAGDAAPLEASVLSALPPGRLAEMTFAFHPAASIIRSAHPIATIWAMNTGDMDLRSIDPWVGEDALVTRPRLTVQVRVLAPGGAAFLSALATRAPFGEAIATALRASPGFDLTANLTCMLEAGAIASIR